MAEAAAETAEVTKDDLRKKYPLVSEETTCWDIYDEVDARIVAVFYRESDACEYLAFKNGHYK
jgi:hypothetical protein